MALNILLLAIKILKQFMYLIQLIINKEIFNSIKNFNKMC